MGVLGYLFYSALGVSILLAIWGICRRSPKKMYRSALLSFLCSLLALWSIGVYLLLLPILFLLIGVFFSRRVANKNNSNH